MISVSIVGTAGLPASYGGFETLAENLVDHAQKKTGVSLAVYCGKGPGPRKQTYKGATLRYLPFKANGMSSVIYDAASLLSSALWYRDKTILLLGVSGAIFLPVIRLLSSAKIVTNIDGIEWQRNKWGAFATWFLKLSEKFAIRFSHSIIADNQGIKEYVSREYGRTSHFIAYGGNHAYRINSAHSFPPTPKRFSLSICRIEPENNVDMILSAFANVRDHNLVFIGNWDGSNYGRSLRMEFKLYENIHLLDPIYDLDVLSSVRLRAATYIHGHSAGGTNPSLVEMMYFGLPVFAYDCNFNRHTTQNKAIYFRSSLALEESLSNVGNEQQQKVANSMREIARTHYHWDNVAKAYFDLLA